MSGFRQLLAHVDPASTTGTVFDVNIINEFESISCMIWTKWKSILDDQSPSTFWQAGIRRAQSMSISSESAIKPAIGMVASKFDTIVHASELASWCAAHVGATYMNQASAGRFNNTISKVDPRSTILPDPCQLIPQSNYYRAEST